MSNTSSIIERSDVTITDMQLGIDQRKYTAVKTHAVPPAYTKTILPGHEAEVIEGKFGAIINQWLHEPEYKVCVSYLVLNRKITLLAKATEPCTTFFMPVKNTPVFIRRAGMLACGVKIKENTVLELHFEEAIAAPRMKFNKGTYISLHITVPDKYKYLVADEHWLDKILKHYATRLHHIMKT